MDIADLVKIPQGNLYCDFKIKDDILDSAFVVHLQPDFSAWLNKEP